MAPCRWSATTAPRSISRGVVRSSVALCACSPHRSRRPRSVSAAARAQPASAGAGGIAGHFTHNIPKDKLREMTETLEAGDSGLVIVAVNPQGSDLTPMLAGAQKVVIDSTTKGDLEGAYEDAVKQAGA